MQDLAHVRLGVIGLGYVGLPLAVEFARLYPVTRFDPSAARVAELRAGRCGAIEVSAVDLATTTGLTVCNDEFALVDGNVCLVTIQAPVDDHQGPDLCSAQVVDIVAERASSGVWWDVPDPRILPGEAAHEYGITRVATPAPGGAQYDVKHLFPTSVVDGRL